MQKKSILIFSFILLPDKTKPGLSMSDHFILCPPYYAVTTRRHAPVIQRPAFWFAKNRNANPSPALLIHQSLCARPSEFHDGSPPPAPLILCRFSLPAPLTITAYILHTLTLQQSPSSTPSTIIARISTLLTITANLLHTLHLAIIIPPLHPRPDRFLPFSTPLIL